MSSYFFSPQQQYHHASQQHHQHQQQHHQQHHQQQQHPLPPSSHAAASSSNSHHGGRSRRSHKSSHNSNNNNNNGSSSSNNNNNNSSHRQFRGVKSMRELSEAPAVSAFRARFEAGRSFDLDDDLEFCPSLLTEDDLQSIHSYASDRSSLASLSPDSSPLQHQIQPAQQVTPSISLSPASISNASASAAAAFGYSLNQMKIHQPSAVRVRNAIPIVNPSTGMRVSSPTQRW
ncbi:uncharacterized protein PADG_03418 [Paracoccidioides brasiliensis Pb18]|uniref:Uncharacterized protein n=1 Tax=Paracoccidioides brasiliensis (strain Pb18) TaxID=502780 RepID=C1G8B3_PARBD|nr:uncharacterized protein PADG_03418 [Paracoccidioides brasiliensis Pb18]EEH47320.2 hypothetical protein PADG_03418 [Paracoccidioides brasiliensis Pb18]